MIEITLTGDEAAYYIQAESQREEKIMKLLDKLSTIQGEHKELQKKYDNLSSTIIPMNASVKVRHDTDILKGLESKRPSFISKNIPTTENSVPKDITGTYTRHDLDLIYARLQKLPTNQDRSLKSIAGALGRKPSSVRDKLKNLGIKVVKGMCYKKD